MSFCSMSNPTFTFALAISFTSTDSNDSIAVLLGWSSPYLDFIFFRYAMTTPTMSLIFALMSAMSLRIFFSSSSFLFESKCEMLRIGICTSFSMSVLTMSLLNKDLNALHPSKTLSIISCWLSQDSSSLYILFSMNNLASILKWNESSRRSRDSLSSPLVMSTSLITFLRRTSLTVIKRGTPSHITRRVPFMDISQSVYAYSSFIRSS